MPRRHCVSGGYGYGLFMTDDLRLGGSSATAAAIPGSARTCAGTRRPGSVSSRSATPATRRCSPRSWRRWRCWSRDRRARSAASSRGRHDRGARTVERLLARWDDAEADALFSMNVDARRARSRRRRAADRGPPGDPRHADARRVGRAGEPRAVPPRLVAARRTRPRPGRDPDEPGASAAGPGPGPDVRAGAAAGGLADIARRLAASLGTPGPAWPADLRLAAGLDLDAIGRALRAAEARFGPVDPRRPDRVGWRDARHVAADGRPRRRRPQPRAGPRRPRT